jgi:uncharacterized OsmC-like protein
MNAIGTMNPQTHVNGIPVSDVQALIEAVQLDPAAGMTRWRVANTWQGGARSTAKVEGFEIGAEHVRRPFEVEVDEPLQLGGTNLYANPQEYLLGALNACMTVGFTALCALHGIEIERLEIVTEGDIDLRGFFGLDPSISPGYDRLETTVTVRGAAPAAEFQRIFEMMLATSPNFHNISRPIDVTPKLIVG